MLFDTGRRDFRATDAESPSNEVDPMEPACYKWIGECDMFLDLVTALLEYTQERYITATHSEASVTSSFSKLSVSIHLTLAMCSYYVKRWPSVYLSHLQIITSLPNPS